MMSWCNCNAAPAAEPQGCLGNADVSPLNMVKQAHKHADGQLRSACRKVPSTCCRMSSWRQKLLCLTVESIPNSSRARQSRITHFQDTDRTSWLQNIGRFTVTFRYLCEAISDKVRTRRRPCPQLSSHAQHVPMRALFACSWNRNTVRAVDSPILIMPIDIASTSRSPWCKSIRSHSTSHRPIRCPMMC